MRWTASVHVTALVLQMAFALTFLSGVAEIYAAHQTFAWVVLSLGILQAMAAFAFGVARTGAWFSAMAFAIATLEALQIQLGRTAETEAHVLLALLLWGLSLAFLIRVWGPGWGKIDTGAAI